MERHHRGAAHPYPRTARINVLIQEVVATEIARLVDADERLRLVTVTEVVCAPDMKTATVYFDTLADEIAEAIEEHRRHLQLLLGREMRAKRTPTLRFAADPVIEAGERIEAALRRSRARADPPAAP